MIVQFKRKLVFGEWGRRGFECREDRQMPVGLYRVVDLPFAPFPGLDVVDNDGLWMATVDRVCVFLERGERRIVCTAETHEIAMYDPAAHDYSEAKNLELIKNRIGAMLRAGWHVDE